MINKPTPDLKQLDGQSMNLNEHNIEQIKKLFPNVFSEGKIDFDALKSELGEHIEAENERYHFTWNGKEQAKRMATTPTLGTLRPAPEESVNWDNTENLYIEGDNLEVLKLLQKSYFGKVKMIYIDPPYNTGKDFVYKDDFKDNLANYQRLTGQKDDEGNPLTTNADSSGRYHSNWLNMMYPRLKLARNLLRDDGVIFISIDDHEVHNLRKICDEIFGEANFISNFVWKRKKEVSNDSKNVSIQAEYFLAYSKTSSTLLTLEELSKEYVATSYKEPNEEFSLGKWRPVPITVSKGLSGGGYEYEIQAPNGKKHNKLWAYPQNSFMNLESKNLVYWGSDGNAIPQRVMYAHESKGQPCTNLWDNTATNKEGKKLILELFGNNYFDTPKPVNLLIRLLKLSTQSADITLDFFSGSATTSHAVMQLNAEDNGNRNFIMVQIPEPTPKNSEAQKAGYETIAEIGKERIRRAAKKVKEEHPDTQADLGFKVFKLDTSNIKKWQPNLDDLETDLLSAVDNILPDRTSQDLLFEVLIKYGLPLTLPIKQLNIQNNGQTYQAWNVANNALIACFDKNLTLDTVQAIAELSTPENPVLRVIFRDASFIDDITKTNAIQRLKQAGIDDVLSI
jgi:adenine-specific DNA-methyltransferase